MNYQNKICWITGASSGIGEAIAHALADEGCNVAICARNKERLDKTVSDLQAKGVKAIGVIADLSSEAGCQSFIEEAAKKLVAEKLAAEKKEKDDAEKKVKEEAAQKAKEEAAKPKEKAPKKTTAKKKVAAKRS